MGNCIRYDPRPLLQHPISTPHTHAKSLSHCNHCEWTEKRWGCKKWERTEAKESRIKTGNGSSDKEQKSETCISRAKNNENIEEEIRAEETRKSVIVQALKERQIHYSKEVISMQRDQFAQYKRTTAISLYKTSRKRIRTSTTPLLYQVVWLSWNVRIKQTWWFVASACFCNSKSC